MNKQEENADTMDHFAAADKKKFDDAIGRENDPTMVVLRAHLFSENLLERIIRLQLPRGDKLIESSSFSYSQKLMIVDTFDMLGDPIVSSLRGLNRLRNQCAHELGKIITDSDVVRAGSPLGKIFTEMHRAHKYDAIATLRETIHYIIGYMTGLCHSLEESSTKQVKEQDSS